MQKIVKKWGEGVGIYLDKEDCKILNLRLNNVVDVEIVKIRQVKNGN